MPNPGSKYVALANISLPRMGEDAKERQTDLVLKGETLTLSSDRARPLLERSPPVIAKASDHHGAVLLQPRQLSGRLRVPPSHPPRGYDGPRADPPGSSAIQVLQEIPADESPEANEPQPGSETDVVDALDLPPGTRVSTGA